MEPRSCVHTAIPSENDTVFRAVVFVPHPKAAGVAEAVIQAKRTTVVLRTQRKKSVYLIYYCSAGITFSLGFLRHSSISTGPDRA